MRAPAIDAACGSLAIAFVASAAAFFALGRASAVPCVMISVAVLALRDGGPGPEFLYGDRGTEKSDPAWHFAGILRPQANEDSSSGLMANSGTFGPRCSEWLQASLRSDLF